ncbi:hypothetical protein BpHYR1_010314 [Brachionus plicatilis]|uniref:Uncharacterized protein n=1 Tax=Brachionus plicatilis TaxID=10195 RepID=A0A3M7QJ18_BRAPC|nr:hypothetical protein BpHYR1_010314 [Brachionus plicatilis]
MVYRYYEFFILSIPKLINGIEWFWKGFNQKNFVITFISTIIGIKFLALDSFSIRLYKYLTIFYQNFIARVNLNRRLDFLDWDNNQERMRPIIELNEGESSSSFIVLYLTNNT